MDYIDSIAFFGTSALIASFLLRQKAKKTATVSELYIYPIKSCGGIKVSEALVGKRGFALDRIFMLIDKESVFVSQRTEPKMALIAQNIDEKSNVLTLSSPGSKSFKIDLDISKISHQVPINCSVWGEDCTAYVVKEAGEWFCSVLNVPKGDYRLVRMAGSLQSLCCRLYFLRFLLSNMAFASPSMLSSIICLALLNFFGDQS